MPSSIPRLFLADDNAADGMLLRLAFSDAGLSLELMQVFDGAEAWEVLRQAARTRPFPYAVIVIDPALPCLSGLELLAELNRLPALAGIPKVVLTNSLDPGDRFRAMRHAPALYLVKPDDYHGMVTLVGRLTPWLGDVDRSSADTPTGSPSLTEPA